MGQPVGAKVESSMTTPASSRASPLPQAHRQPEQRRRACGSNCLSVRTDLAGDGCVTPAESGIASQLVRKWNRRCLLRPLRGQARTNRLTANRNNGAVPVGAGLPAKRPEQTLQIRDCAPNAPAG